MRLVALLVVCSLVVGCSSQSTTDTAVTPPVQGVEDSVAVSPAGDTNPAASDAKTAGGMEIALTPSNTRIQFTGTHKKNPPPDPDARVGTFSAFDGKAVVADDELKSISVVIKIDSIETPQEKLTNHLKAPDFFDAREYPTAKFETTRIARNVDGDHQITGDLTMLTTTKEVSFPARVGMQDGKLSLSAQLKIDRTEFGMTDHTDNVNEEVSLQIDVGSSAQ